MAIDASEQDQNGETYREYEDALTKLGLEKEEHKDDVNVVWLRGKKENLEMIFKKLIDGLDGRNHEEDEVRKDWEYVCQNRHLRPGGTYMVTVKNRSDHFEMIVMNVNARDFEPIVNDMHLSIRKSVISAAEKLPVNEPNT